MKRMGEDSEPALNDIIGKECAGKQDKRHDF
jgi:hypothetical protein